MRTKRTETPLTGPWAKCGQPMAPAHSPLHLSGLFCGSCCPLCAPLVATGTEPLPDADGAVLAHADARVRP